MWIVIGLFLVCGFLVWPNQSRRKTGNRPLFRHIGRQCKRNYYSRRAFLRIGGALAAAGILAYSGVDEVVERFNTDTVKSKTSDQISAGVKHLGENFWFLNWGLLAVMDAWLRTNIFTRWGRKNFEAMVVGLPLLWTVQRGLGANRPSSDDGSPRWRPMNAANSASGHTFMGAVPFLTIANRIDSKSLKNIARLLSPITGWSRINDRKHYLSQVVLGWTIAFNAVSSVDDSTTPTTVQTQNRSDHD